jgi:pimeloyl-ACP methyl ester carboxylesterase
MSVPPPDTPAPRVPAPASVFRELLGWQEIPLFAARLPALLGAPRGARAVLVLPGFGAGDASTWLLRRYLAWLGHDVRGWGLGTNDGDVPRLLARVLGLVADLAASHGGPIDLVGWSLGGYVAREAARDRPDLVRRVVTMGSPVVGGPKYTAVGRRYLAAGYDLDAIEAAVEARGAVPIRVPITAIFSRADGIVAWEACIDRRSPDVEHVEVAATHLGLGFSAEVLALVARRLAL